MSDYVYLKNLNGQQIKPVTDLAAINMTTTNGIGVSTVNGGTIGIIDGYIESAYYTEMADPAVGAANVSSAYVDGGTAVAILGAYTVASAVDTAAPSQQKVPSEKAVVDALNNVVVSGVSYYAGTGIDINAGHTVSVANVPQSSVAGLETTLTGINTAVAAKQDAISAGYRMSLDGTTLNQQRYFAIESPTSATITLQAGHAYKITVTNSSKTLDSEQIPANQFGLEGHAEIFVAGTGLIKTTSNVVLAQALEPDAVNNCTVRFHDGKAIISVEDHVAGYIVVSASGTTAGTLPYALSTASNEYISFDASLNNMTLSLAGATTYAGEKHVVGNGYAETIISGGIVCTSKTTFSNLSMDGVVNSGGTMTLGDAYIPSGSTVAVSGGGLAVEKVTGDGGVIDLGYDATMQTGGTYIPLSSTMILTGVAITGGSANYGGCVGGAYSNKNNLIASNVSITSCYAVTGGGGFYIPNGRASFVSCSFLNNSAGYTGGALNLADVASVDATACVFTGNKCNSGGMAFVKDTASLELTSCVVSGNIGTKNGILVRHNATLTLTDCTIDDPITAMDTPSINMNGNNKINIISGGTASVTISSGAILDLTGNTNAALIAPGGGITLDASPSSGVVIIGSAGSTTQTRTFAGGGTITGSAVTKIGAISGATVTLPSSSCQIEFVKSGETVVSSAFIQASETPYVLETQQGAGTVLVRAIED